jgi:hypothetical protein
LEHAIEFKCISLFEVLQLLSNQHNILTQIMGIHNEVDTESSGLFNNDDAEPEANQPRISNPSAGDFPYCDALPPLYYYFCGNLKKKKCLCLTLQDRNSNENGDEKKTYDNQEMLPWHVVLPFDRFDEFVGNSDDVDVFTDNFYDTSDAVLIKNEMFLRYRLWHGWNLKFAKSDPSRGMVVMRNEIDLDTICTLVANKLQVACTSKNPIDYCSRLIARIPVTRIRIRNDVHVDISEICPKQYYLTCAFTSGVPDQNDFAVNLALNTLGCTVADSKLVAYLSVHNKALADEIGARFEIQLSTNWTPKILKDLCGDEKCELPSPIPSTVLSYSSKALPNSNTLNLCEKLITRKFRPFIVPSLTEQLSKITQNLQRNDIANLNLSNNFLWDVDLPEIADFIITLPKNVTVDLTNSNIALSEAEALKAMSQIVQHAGRVILTENETLNQKLVSKEYQHVIEFRCSFD